MKIGLRQFIDLLVEIAVGLPEILLGVDEAAEHAVEGDPELFKLVGCVDLGAGLHVAPPHLVGHVAKVLERLDDHIADDRIRGEHGQKHRHDGGGGQNRPVPIDRLAGGGVGHHHLHHRHEIVFGQERSRPVGRLGGSRPGIGNDRGVTDHPAILVTAGTTAPPPHRLVVMVFRVVGRAKLTVFGGWGRRPALRCRVGQPVLEVGEDGGVEPGVFPPLLRDSVGFKKPTLVLLALQRAAQKIDRAGILLLRLKRLPVVLQHDGIDEMPARAPRRRVDEFLGAAAIPPETAGDQHEQTEPEQEAAFPLQAGFAQDVLECSVRHT